MTEIQPRCRFRCEPHVANWLRSRGAWLRMRRICRERNLAGKRHTEYPLLWVDLSWRSALHCGALHYGVRHHLSGLLRSFPPQLHWPLFASLLSPPASHLFPHLVPCVPPPSATGPSHGPSCPWRYLHVGLHPPAAGATHGDQVEILGLPAPRRAEPWACPLFAPVLAPFRCGARARRSKMIPSHREPLPHVIHWDRLPKDLDLQHRSIDRCLRLCLR